MNNTSQLGSSCMLAISENCYFEPVDLSLSIQFQGLAEHYCDICCISEESYNIVVSVGKTHIV